jgi:hypothetical protein
MLPVPFDLTPKMRAFAEAYCDLGGQNATKAAMVAGYAQSAAAAVASRLLRRDDVLAYLRHLVETKFRAEAIKSATVLAKIRDDETAPVGERRKAASELLDRAGLIVAKLNQHHVTIEDTRPEAQIAEILRLCKAQGIEPSALGLGGLVAFVGREKAEALAASPVLDAEFSEDAEPEPQSGRQENVASEAGGLTQENPLAEDDLSDLL